MGTPKRILVIDDQEMIRSMTSSLLFYMGYTPICVENYKQAITVYEKDAIDNKVFSAVIIDINIPNETIAIETMPKILKDKNKDTFIFISSGDTSHPIIESPKEYGFTTSLIKPYSLSELKKVLTTYL